MWWNGKNVHDAKCRNFVCYECFTDKKFQMYNNSINSSTNWADEIYIEKIAFHNGENHHEVQSIYWITFYKGNAIFFSPFKFQCIPFPWVANGNRNKLWKREKITSTRNEIDWILSERNTDFLLCIVTVGAVVILLGLWRSLFVTI